MTTRPLYYEEPYIQDAQCHILNIQNRGRQMVTFELDQTIFYPEGGGQPSDQGDVTTATGAIKVQAVHHQGERIIHEGILVGSVEPGQEGKATLKWSRRHKNMRVHSAGHLLHDILMTTYPDLQAIRGNHGDKAFLEYSGTLEPSIRETLERTVNEAIQADIPIRTWDSSYEEVIAICKFVPSNLPKNKELRVLRIGDFDPMPDGGVQVRSTKEIGRVAIHHIINEDDKVMIRYGVAGPT